MKVIIDADSMSYLLGWNCKDLPFNPDSYVSVVEQTDTFVKNILIASKATAYMGFLGGVHPTFRHMMNREYKANRGLTKPDWWNQWGGVINHRLKNFWKFYYVEGIEAEDAVGMIAYNELYNDICIAHIDKDLNQIPGVHYNYKNLNTYTVDTVQASYNLFKQVLTGDTTDNLPGLPGIGPKRAEEILAAAKMPIDHMFLTINKFCEKFGERTGLIKFAESYAMVKILDKCPEELKFIPADYQFYPCKELPKIEDFTNQPPADETGNISQYVV